MLDDGMVAIDGKIWGTKLSGKHRRGDAAAYSVLAKSVDPFSQTFTYDPLNRVTANTLGGVTNQSWTLDTDFVLLRQEPKSRLSEGAAYRETSYTSNGTTQTQTANAQNQITSISGSTTPTYDNNGNMTTDQSGNTFTYNAWNQLVTAKNSSGQIIVQYTYDARGYRVSETYPIGGNGVAAGTTKYLYYSNQEQVIEERWNGTANSNTQYQYVWSASYVNAMVLRDTYSGGTLQADDRIYTTYDANYDVTSLIGYDINTGKWGVVERFAYSPYGTGTVLSPSGTVTSDGFNWQYMYQGGRQDPITGLYHFDHRDYSTTLGTWTSQDPDGYIDGANTYQYEAGNPLNNLDPWGQYKEHTKGKRKSTQHKHTKPHSSKNQQKKKLHESWQQRCQPLSPAERDLLLFGIVLWVLLKHGRLPLPE